MKTDLPCGRIRYSTCRESVGDCVQATVARIYDAERDLMTELPHENISRVSHGSDPGWIKRIYVISEEPIGFVYYLWLPFSKGFAIHASLTKVRTYETRSLLA